MSERDRGMAIAMLAEAFQVKSITPATVRIYNDALAKLPAGVLSLMVQRAIETRKPRWGCLPTVAELREDAEAVRVERLAALSFQPCAVNGNCSAQGFTEVEVDGVKRMVRCRCWTEFQAQRAALQVGDQPLALPAARESEVA